MSSTQQQRCSTKRSNPKAESKIAVAEVVEERKAAVAGVGAEVEGKGKPEAKSKMAELMAALFNGAAEAARRKQTEEHEEGANKSTKPARRTKVVRVKQEYTDYLLANLPKPYCGMTQELIDQAQPPEFQEKLRATMARVAATHQPLYDQQVNFLEQYNLKGYAEEEIEDVDTAY